MMALALSAYSVSYSADQLQPLVEPQPSQT